MLLRLSITILLPLGKSFLNEIGSGALFLGDLSANGFCGGGGTGMEGLGENCCCGTTGVGFGA